MYGMVDKEYVRKKHFVDGWSIRRLSTQLKIARQTVRKLLVDADIPAYTRQQERPCPVMDPYREVIKEWLDEDKTAPVKERHTAARIYERLTDEYGFTGGESTVRHYIRKLRGTQSECYLKLEANPGEQMQVDFGHAEVDLNGERTKVCLFCMRLKYSLVPFVIAFPTERLEAFLEGHVRGFAYFGGIPREGLYDNATTQVVKVLAGPEREEHAWFSGLRAHYLFDSHFCQPAHGNEKGTVESLVKYVRSRALVPVPSFASWDELNAYLLRWCDRIRVKYAEAWEIEQAALRSLPAAVFSSARPVPVKVNSYALATVDRIQYSVPCQYTGQMIMAKAYVDRIDFIASSEVVATHARCYQRGEVRMEIGHYLTALERKPHAVTNASVVRQLPPIFGKLRAHLTQAHTRGYKDFLLVLLLLREHSLSELTMALESMDIAEITASSVQKRLNPAICHANEVNRIVTTPAHVAQYDQLLQEVG
ncbi:IS21 family transposase [Paenibacillus filicis]|uniref:IS21 family transposase n=1 Tax=Paenibacillus gyeongsangnamensis TaxID=3388067 RepID=A0ABT4QKD1_9BACL|nr:IS21 family transposase [Paenibacillus filicis]MCZ8517317.1 IS21 family transposase [Paenibacillus filicis]